MIEKKKFSKISIITAITFGIMILLNILANALPINGQNTGQISDAYSNLFAPAAYTFSIWGLIYLLLALHIFYQLGFFRKGDIDNKDNLLNNIGILFSISSIANTIWILAWHYEKMLLSTVLISLILICLILINSKIMDVKLSLKEKIFIYIPFSLYFGWITIATIANITVLLVSIGWKGFGISEVVWTMVILIVGFLIASITIYRQKNIIYGFVIIWAYLGIYVKHISESGWNNKYPLVIASVTICIALLILTIIYTLFKSKKRGEVY